jgi:hypothetical protein
MCRLAILKWSVMEKLVGFVVGQPHGDCLGLLCGQRGARSRARATDEQQRNYDDRCYFHKTREAA